MLISLSLSPSLPLLDKSLSHLLYKSLSASLSLAECTTVNRVQRERTAVNIVQTGYSSREAFFHFINGSSWVSRIVSFVASLFLHLEKIQTHVLYLLYSVSRCLTKCLTEMVTKIVASHWLVPHFSVTHLSLPVISFMGFGNYGGRRGGVSLVLRGYGGSLGFVEGRGRKVESWWCLCKGGEGIDGEVGLEAEILEFMNKSEKPDKFPTKKELIDGGRIDLVEAIIKTGGWLSLGWETDDDECDELEECTVKDSESADFDIVDFQERVESLQGRISFQEDEVESMYSSQSVSSSGRSV